MLNLNITPISYDRANILFAALTYSVTKLATLAIHTSDLARELFSVVVRTYSTLYSTLSPTHTPVYRFIVADHTSAVVHSLLLFIK